jgi:hypothetical protein
MFLGTSVAVGADRPVRVRQVEVVMVVPMHGPVIGDHV